MPEAVTCENCGDVFEVEPSRAKGARFCSRECYREAGIPGRKSALEHFLEEGGSVEDLGLSSISNGGQS